MPSLPRTIAVQGVGNKNTGDPIKMEPTEVQFLKLSFTDWLADRLTASSPTIPDPTASVAWTPTPSAPVVSGMVRTNSSVSFLVTPSAAYSGQLALTCTLNSGLPSEEIKLVKLAVTVADST